MDIPGASKEFGTVALYECLGTAWLVYAVICSGGDIFAWPFTYMITIIICRPISGGHANPAVSLGVFLKNRNMKNEFLMFMTMVIG